MKSSTPYLGEHKEVMHHIALLKCLEGLGIRIKEVHNAWSFKQEAWMAEYIEELSTKRAKEKDPVKKRYSKIWYDYLRKDHGRRHEIPEHNPLRRS